MKRLVMLCFLALPGCWGEDVEKRTYDLGPDQAIRFEVKSDAPLWVTFEAPEELDFDTLSRTCPILKDGASDQPMCAEIAQIDSEGEAIALIRGVIGGGLKFTPIDGTLDLRLTNFSSMRIAYQIKIGPGD